MHLLLFLALLAPPAQQTVQADPNYNCAMHGTCITTGQQPFQIYKIDLPQQKAVKQRIQAWHQFVNECQHRSWKHGYRHPSWCKVVK